MKALIVWSEMGSYPAIEPYREDEDDVRRTTEVPEDLYERYVEAHEQFCAVLAEIDVECVEFLKAPAPDAPRLGWGLHNPDVLWTPAPRIEGYAAECSVCKAITTVVAADRPGEEEHERALREVLARNWRERRYGGIACPECAPEEKHEDLLLPPVPTATERAPRAQDDKEE